MLKRVDKHAMFNSLTRDPRLYWCALMPADVQRPFLFCQVNCGFLFSVVLIHGRAHRVLCHCKLKEESTSNGSD